VGGLSGVFELFFQHLASNYGLLILGAAILINVMIEMVNDLIAQYLSNRETYSSRQTLRLVPLLGIAVWLQYSAFILGINSLINILGVSSLLGAVVLKSILLMGISFLFAVEYMFLPYLSIDKKLLTSYSIKEQFNKTIKLFSIGGLGLIYFITNLLFYGLETAGIISIATFLILLGARAIPTDIYTYSVVNSGILNLNPIDFIKVIFRLPVGVAKDKKIRREQISLLDMFGRIYRLKLFDKDNGKIIVLELNPESAERETRYPIFDISCDGKYKGFIGVALDNKFRIETFKIDMHKGRQQESPFIVPFLTKWFNSQKGSRLNVTHSTLDFIQFKKMFPRIPFYITSSLNEEERDKEKLEERR